MLAINCRVNDKKEIVKLKIGFSERNLYPQNDS